jgi:hypothetical protein
VDPFAADHSAETNESWFNSSGTSLTRVRCRDLRRDVDPFAVDHSTETNESWFHSSATSLTPVRCRDLRKACSRRTHPGRSTMRMLQKLRPGAGHRRLWPALLVAGLLGGVGLALFFLL